LDDTADWSGIAVHRSSIPQLLKCCGDLRRGPTATARSPWQKVPAFCALKHLKMSAPNSCREPRRRYTERRRPPPRRVLSFLDDLTPDAEHCRKPRRFRLIVDQLVLADYAPQHRLPDSDELALVKRRFCFLRDAPASRIRDITPWQSKRTSVVMGVAQSAYHNFALGCPRPTRSDCLQLPRSDRVFCRASRMDHFDWMCPTQWAIPDESSPIDYYHRRQRTNHYAHTFPWFSL